MITFQTTCLGYNLKALAQGIFMIKNVSARFIYGEQYEMVLDVLTIFSLLRNQESY